MVKRAEYAYDDNGNVIERKPADGHVFAVYEEANDSKQMWLHSSTSLLDAVAYYESAAEQAATAGGLLAMNGVQEVTVDEYNNMRMAYTHMWSRDHE